MGEAKMDKKEFGTIAMALKTYYPRENLLPNDKAMDLWYMQLQDLPFDVANNALNEWAAINKWSPAISELREVCLNTMYGEPETWSEGWEQVSNAIRKYGLGDIKSAMFSLSETTREAVRRLGYRNLCYSENETSDRAQFRAVYESIAQSRDRTKRIPKAIAEQSKRIKELYTLKSMELLE